MLKKVFIDSCDEFLLLRLRVLCTREGLSICEAADDKEIALVVRDLDAPLYENPITCGARTLTLSRVPSRSANAHLPMKNTDLCGLMRGIQLGARLSLSDDGKCAILDGKHIRLTEIEATLLRLLIEAEGRFVSHGDAVRHIWAGEASAGAVNVYIHYLREKLEHTGERIILAKRGCGYAIEKRFLGGTEEC